MSPPAVSMGNASVVVRGASTLSGSGRPLPGLAIDGTGTLRIDPDTVLLNASNPAFGAGLGVTRVAMPSLYSWPGGPGGVASASLFGPVGGVGALLAGFPGAPHVLPGLADLAWILPGSGVQSTAGGATLTGSYSVPNAPWVLGVTVCWQGITHAGGSGLQLSNAAVSAH